MDTEAPEKPKRKRRPLRKKLFATTIWLLVFLTMLEVGARICVALGMFEIRSFEIEEGVKKLEFVADISEVTGVWHVPNASLEVPTPSGKVRYQTNSHGMRDRPREKSSAAPRRVVVLGDSFVEGWMVAAEHRFTDLLEAPSGIEFLNFGCSGDFGTIQQWLLYRDVASEFSHSEIALFFLPDNDFKDNDPERNSATRYRPYLRQPSDRAPGTPAFEVYYPKAFKPVTTKRVKLSAGKKLRHRLYNLSYFCNLLSDINLHTDTTSAYSGFSEADWERVEFSLDQLAKAAGPQRRLSVFIIPRDDDLRAAEGSSGGPTITDKLEAWAAAREDGAGARVRVIDLKPGFQSWLEKDGNQLRSLFIPGDGHWTRQGHQLASEIIAPHFAEAPELEAAQ